MQKVIYTAAAVVEAMRCESFVREAIAKLSAHERKNLAALVPQGTPILDDLAARIMQASKTRKHWMLALLGRSVDLAYLDDMGQGVTKLQNSFMIAYPVGRLIDGAAEIDIVVFAFVEKTFSYADMRKAFGRLGQMLPHAADDHDVFLCGNSETLLQSVNKLTDARER